MEIIIRKPTHWGGVKLNAEAKENATKRILQQRINLAKSAGQKITKVTIIDTLDLKQLSLF